MCGIAGFFTRTSTPISRNTVELMTRSLAHRGPDGEGIRLWDRSTPAIKHPAAGHVGLGHRRLAIVDLSERGQQPMSTADGRYTMAFNGEIYNFRRIAADLGKSGFVPQSRTDTEVALEAFARLGHAAVESFVGMFAIAIYDAKRDELHLFRDRLGKKPLYYAEGATFLFGSELKALRAAQGTSPELSMEALAEYLAFQRVSGGKTIFRGVSKLPPAHSAVVSARGTTVRRFWNARSAFHEKRAISFDEAVAEFDELFDDAVKLRLDCDVPVGCFLSGGVDSSLVAMFVRRHRADRFKTFSIGFDDPDYDESAMARRISAELETEHAAVVMREPDVEPLLERLPRYFDEPFADSSQLPTFMVSELARKDVTVTLSGDGGDELFFGYSRHHRMAGTAAFRLLSGLGRSERGVRSLVTRLKWRAGRVEAFRARVAAGIGPLYAAELSSMRESDVRRLIGRVAVLSEDERSALEDPELDMADRLMACDLAGYLPEDILVKVDRATMAHALEARAPLLDHRIVEFAASLPLRHKWNGKNSKLLLRRVLEHRVPESLRTSAKRGFGWPLDRWLVPLLRKPKFVRLFDSDAVRRQGLLSPEGAQAVLRDSARGLLGATNAYTYVAFQLWLREWMPHLAIGV